VQYIVYEYYGVFFFELKENDVMLSMHPHVFHYNELKLKFETKKLSAT